MSIKYKFVSILIKLILYNVKYNFINTYIYTVQVMTYTYLLYNDIYLYNLNISNINLNNLYYLIHLNNYNLLNIFNVYNINIS